NLHAGKFVISSRLGGPVDFIRQPLNGLMFAGGDPVGLAACITRLATGQVRLPSPKEIHEATKLVSYPEHVPEVESIYRERLGGRARGRREAAPVGTTNGVHKRAAAEGSANGTAAAAVR